MQFSFLSDLCIVHSPSPPQPTYTWVFSLYKNSLPQKKSSISTSFIKFSRWCHTFCVDCRRDWWPPLKLSFAVSHEIFFVNIPGFLLYVPVPGIFFCLFVFCHASFSLSTFAPLPFPGVFSLFPFPLKMSFPYSPPHYHPPTSPPTPSPSPVRCPEGPPLTCASGAVCR